VRQVSDEQPYSRPEVLAYWPDDWRHQWGKVANDLQAGGLDWREAERQAFETVSAEREQAGDDELVPVPRPRDPVPFPAFESLPGLDEVLAARGAERLPPRPAGRVPLFGLTSRLSVLCLLDLRPRDLEPAGWETLDIVKVTGLFSDGWECWHPVEPGDRDAVHGERQRRFDESRRRAPASAGSAASDEPRPRMKPPRRVLRHRRGCS
jgi:hypothetical protein